jgi:hypothetical protein
MNVKWIIVCLRCQQHTAYFDPGIDTALSCCNATWAQAGQGVAGNSLVRMGFVCWDMLMAIAAEGRQKCEYPSSHTPDCSSHVWMHSTIVRWKHGLCDDKEGFVDGCSTLVRCRGCAHWDVPMVIWLRGGGRFMCCTRPPPGQITHCESRSTQRHWLGPLGMRPQPDVRKK